MISYDFLWFPIRDHPGTAQGRPDKIAHMCCYCCCYCYYCYYCYCYYCCCYCCCCYCCSYCCCYYCCCSCCYHYCYCSVCVCVRRTNTYVLSHLVALGRSLGGPWWEIKGNHKKSFEIIWNLMTSYEIIGHHRKLKETIEIITTHTKSYEIIWNHMKSYDIINNHKKSKEFKRNHMKS